MIVKHIEPEDTGTRRIATVKATGKRYVVRYIDIDAGTVLCWGEVVGYKTTHKLTREQAAKVKAGEMAARVRLTHQANTLKFLRTAVDVAEVAVGYREAVELLHQAKRALR